MYFRNLWVDAKVEPITSRSTKSVYMLVLFKYYYFFLVDTEKERKIKNHEIKETVSKAANKVRSQQYLFECSRTVLYSEL